MIKIIRIMFLACIALMLTQVSAKKKTEPNTSTESQGQITELHLKVAGMVCPFCSYSLELALKTKPYIKKVKNIDLNKGTIEISIKSNTNYTLDKMKADLDKTIREATFTFNEIEKVIRK